MTALQYCTVIGTFNEMSPDATDDGLDPDSTPLQGQITLVCDARDPDTGTASRLSLVSETPPRTIVIDPFTVPLDDTGSFVIEVPGSGQTGVTVPDDFTYTVKFALKTAAGAPVRIASFSFPAPAGETVDLTLVAPVSVVNGVASFVGPPGADGVAGPPGPPELEGMNIVAASGSGTVTLADPIATGKTYNKVTLTGNCTFALPIITGAGVMSITLVVVQDATGGWVPNLPGSTIVQWAGDVLPTIDPTPNAMTEIAFWTEGSGGGWYGVGGIGDLSAVPLYGGLASPPRARIYCDFTTMPAGAPIEATSGQTAVLSEGSQGSVAQPLIVAGVGLTDAATKTSPTVNSSGSYTQFDMGLASTYKGATVGEKFTLGVAGSGGSTTTLQGVNMAMWKNGPIAGIPLPRTPIHITVSATAVGYQVIDDSGNVPSGGTKSWPHTIPVDGSDHTVRAILDFTAHTADIYLDGVYLGSFTHSLISVDTTAHYYVSFETFENLVATDTKPVIRQGWCDTITSDPATPFPSRADLNTQVKSLLASLTAHPPYGAPSTFWQAASNLSTIASLNPTSGKCTWIPFDVPVGGITYKAIGMSCPVAEVGGTTTHTLGVYADSGVGGLPLVLGGPLATVTVTATTGGTVSALFSTPLTLPAGRYWLAYLYVATAAPTTTVKFQALASGTVIPAGSVAAGAHGWNASGLTALPTTGLSLFGEVTPFAIYMQAN